MAGITRRFRRAALRRHRPAWRGVPRGGALAALTTSSLALPGLAHAGGEFGDLGYTAEYKYSKYTEDQVTSSRVQSGSNDRYDIDIHQIHLAGPVTERISLDLNVTHESMTGATPFYVVPNQNGGNPLLVMTNATIHEARTAADLKGTLAFDRGNASLNSGVSVENDYLAINGGVGGERSFNEKNTTLSGGADFSWGRIEPTDAESFGRDSEEQKQQGSMFVSLAQVLGRNAAIQGTLQYQVDHGFLSDPYKRAFVVSTSTPEPDTRPDLRNQVSFLARYRQHIPFLRGTLHADYRFYYDDWHIDAHTFEFAWYQMLWDSFRIIPSVRYYTQSQADFYAPYYLNPRGNDLYSSDYRLSPYGSLTWRVKGETRLQIYNLDLLLNVAYERYTSSGNLAIQNVGTANPGLVDFDMFSVGISSKF
ncbi:MAG TPA: DUF3570 domain-containing protein [Myxococcota bacterium]|nr:DUF3570 domain-containing protein [Myxococcota bacterium]